MRELKIKEDAKKIIEKVYNEIGEFFAWHSDKYNKFKKLVSSIMQDFYNTKITIRKDSYTGGCHLYFTIQKSTADFSNINYFNEYAYLYDNNSKYNDEVKEILDALLFVINKFHYDNSEPMIDYYDTNFYYSVGVSENFELIKAKKPNKENTKKTNNIPTKIKIIDYTDKSWAIIGDTFRYAEKIRSFLKENNIWGTFTHNLKQTDKAKSGWVIGKEKWANGVISEDGISKEKLQKFLDSIIENVPNLLLEEFDTYFSKNYLVSLKKKNKFDGNLQGSQVVNNKRDIEIVNYINNEIKDRKNITLEEYNFISEYTGNDTEEGCDDAYYTPNDIVQFTIKRIKELQHKKIKYILEPTVGIGNYLVDNLNLDYKPKIFGFEVNKLAAKIAQLRCDYKKVNATIFNLYFEQIFLDPVRFSTTLKNNSTWLYDKNDGLKKNGGFDVIIGNPPFTTASAYKSWFKKDWLTSRYEHFFLWKCLNLLSQDGILCFVMPSNFLMNNESYNKFKDKITESGFYLIEAYRFSSDFKGTKIPVDLVIFKRKFEGLDFLLHADKIKKSVYLSNKIMQNTDWKDYPNLSPEYNAYRYGFINYDIENKLGFQNKEIENQDIYFDYNILMYHNRYFNAFKENVFGNMYITKNPKMTLMMQKPVPYLLEKEFKIL